MSEQDGGPAFPVVESGAVSDYSHDGQYHIGFNTADGMSLRDYFAGQALSEMIASNIDGLEGAAHTAKCAYIYADAMLKARQA